MGFALVPSRAHERWGQGTGARLPPRRRFLLGCGGAVWGEGEQARATGGFPVALAGTPLTPRFAGPGGFGHGGGLGNGASPRTGTMAARGPSRVRERFLGSCREDPSFGARFCWRRRGSRGSRGGPGPQNRRAHPRGWARFMTGVCAPGDPRSSRSRRRGSILGTPRSGRSWHRGGRTCGGWCGRRWSARLRLSTRNGWFGAGAFVARSRSISQG